MSAWALGSVPKLEDPTYHTERHLIVDGTGVS